MSRATSYHRDRVIDAAKDISKVRKTDGNGCVLVPMDLLVTLNSRLIRLKEVQLEARHRAR